MSRSVLRVPAAWGAALMLGLLALPGKASAASKCAGPGYLCVSDNDAQIPPGAPSVGSPWPPCRSSCWTWAPRP